MKFTTTFFLSLFVTILPAFAAEKTPWQIDLDANVTLTQNAYSESWIGGEEGAVAGGILLRPVQGDHVLQGGKLLRRPN